MTEHQFVAVTSQNKVDTLIEHLGDARALARLRPDEARRRPPRAQAGASRTSTAGAMHGDMSQAARERTLAKFAAGKISTLVATDVAARGSIFRTSRT